MSRITLLLLALFVSSALAACGGGDAAPETEPADTTGDTAGDEATAGGPTEAPTLALPNQRELEGGLVTGGQPTESDLRAAAAAGYAMVITLRAPSEPGFEAERALAEELGLRFENVPVAGADGIAPANAAAVDALLAEADGPVVLHCGTGNRVGAILALRAFVAGADLESALAVGRDAGLTSLEDPTRARMQELCETTDREC